MTRIKDPMEVIRGLVYTAYWKASDEYDECGRLFKDSVDRGLTDEDVPAELWNRNKKARGNLLALEGAMMHLGLSLTRR